MDAGEDVTPDNGAVPTPTTLNTMNRALLFAVVLTGVLVYFGYQAAIDTKAPPCATNGFPARCYHITQRMCEAIWTKSEETCRETIHKLNLPLGRLLGPIIHKCQLASLDDAFVHNRKSNNECNDMFFQLEDWRRRNDFR